MTALERRQLSRDLSALANASVAEALKLQQARNAVCALVGITGPAGAGKSTLIAKLARFRVTDLPLAIVAIDPSSPLSGGAILGDRIRMMELADDPRIYIRSLATRSSCDGLADNLPSILNRIARAGFAEILLETTGVGQVEYAIRWMVDTMVLVLTPGAGDQVQAMKSGIVETSDVVVINKSDQPGAEQLAREIQAVIRYREKGPVDWVPPVLMTRADNSSEFSELSATIDAHRKAISSVQRTNRIRSWQTLLVSSLIARRSDELLSRLSAEDIARPLPELFDKVARAMGEKSS